MFFFYYYAFIRVELERVLPFITFLFDYSLRPQNSKAITTRLETHYSCNPKKDSYHSALGLFCSVCRYYQHSVSFSSPFLSIMSHILL